MRAIVVGRARGAVREYEAACSMCFFDSVLVVGAMMTSFPYAIDHAVSFHAELFALWARERAAAGLPPVGTYWSARRRGTAPLHLAAPVCYVDCVGGSSGLLATRGVALGALRADRVVLAGVPMAAEAGHEGSDAPWTEASKYWAAWEEHAEELRGRVRSMSGRTRGLLGEPDGEFLGV